MKKIQCMFSILYSSFIFLIFLVRLVSIPYFLPVSHIIIGICVVSILIVIIWKKKDYIEHIMCQLDRTSPYKLMLILFFFSFLTKLSCLLFINIDSRLFNTDTYAYQKTASEIIICGKAITYADYFFGFSHQLFFSLYLIPVIQLFGESQIALGLFFDFMISISIVLMFDIFREPIKQSKAFLALLIYSALPSSILLAVAITHETVFLFLFVISLWLYFRILPTIQKFASRALVLFLSLLFLVLASKLNAIGYVACIAYIIMVLFSNKSPFERVRIVIAFLLVFALSFFASDLLVERFIDKDKVSSPKINSIEWTLFIGSNADSLGKYNSEDQDQFGWHSKDLNTFVDKTDEEVKEIRHNLLINRYETLLQNPFKLIKHFAVKVGGILSNMKYPQNMIVLRKLLEIDGFDWNMYINSSELFIFLIFITFAVYPLFKLNTIMSDIEKMALLFLGGSFILLLFTEFNEKYMISMQPFIWILLISKSCFYHPSLTKKVKTLFNK